VLYQRRIPDNQIVSAKLELQLRGGRYAGVGTQLLGVLSLGAATFFSVEPLYMVGWAVSLLVLNLWWSRRINQTLLTNRHFSKRPTVLRELIAYSVITGLIWSATLMVLDAYLSDLTFYLCVMCIAIISVVNISVSVVIRSAYLAQLVCSLGVISIWLAWHIDQRPFNTGFAVLLVALMVFLIINSEWMSKSFSEMVETSLERAAMSKDLSSLTESLKTRNLQLQDARMQLAEQATIDEMTGLRNRRGVNIIINDELARMKRAQLPVSLIVLDVDHFKTYNDNYGHPAGDQVLQRIANVMLELTKRTGEFAARMGGEEFAMFFPSMKLATALEVAERVREGILNLRIPHEKSLTAEFVTVSIGVVSCVPDWELKFDQLLQAADEALYDSKTSGRNRIMVGDVAPDGVAPDKESE
jgi:diguanylate cyclase (GGDEF)-like protein